MKNLKITCSVVLLVATQIVFAQIGVGTSNPDPSALLDVTSTSKGFLVPRINNTNRNLINNPVLGLIIFNTDANKLEINIGYPISNWVKYSDVGPVGNPGLKGPTGLRGISGVTYSLSGALGSVVGGGTTNVASGLYSTVIGGTTNESSGNNAMIGGGTTNLASGTNATVAGGTTNWAIGDNSFVGGGTTNKSLSLNSSVGGGNTNVASGIGSSISGGTTNATSGENTAIGGGTTNQAVGLYSNISGGNSNRTNGVSSAVSGGRSNFAKSFGEWVGGLNSTDYLAASISIFAPTDRIFNVGNGELPASPSDAFTILKNGLATLPTATISFIETANNKAIMTKEYTDANFSKINTNAPLSPGDFGIVGEIRVTTDYIYTCVATNTWVRTLVEAW